jgi:hypothetical protein
MFDCHRNIFVFASLLTFDKVLTFDGWEKHCVEHGFEKPLDPTASSLQVWTKCEGISRPIGFIDWISSSTNSQLCADAGGRAIEHTCESVENVMKKANPIDVHEPSAKSFQDRCCVEDVHNLWSWMKHGCGSSELDKDHFDAGKPAWTECDGVDSSPNGFSRTVTSKANTALCMDAGGSATVYTCGDVEQLIRWNAGYEGFSVQFQYVCCGWSAIQHAEDSGNATNQEDANLDNAEVSVLNMAPTKGNSTKAVVASNGMHVIPSPSVDVVLFALAAAGMLP